MIRRRLSAIALLHPRAARAVEGQPTPQPLEPLVWPLVGGEQPGIRTFAGHANTVLDIVGRIGTPPSLVIFTEGNHLMVVLSDDIVGAGSVTNHCAMTPWRKGAHGGRARAN